MKGIRNLSRLGALALIAGLLTAALTVPAAAARMCSDNQMYGPVDVKSVTPVAGIFTWDADDLLSYGDGAAGTYMTGQLEVVFMDIATSNPITHYNVTATPTSKPGTSDELGVKASTSKVNRPEQVGDSVTAVLDLEPGTEYAVEVVAVYHNVTLSEKQSKQDVMEAVTYLSPPFFGGGTMKMDTGESADSPSDDGVHFLVYMPDDKLHKLNWLNPEDYGPYDHKWKEAAKKGADILCTNNKGGDLENDCKSEDGVGITHYRVRVLDEDGNTEYVQTKPAKDEDGMPMKGGYTANFNLNDGTYTFQLDAGYKKKGTNSFYALSDTAQVQFSIPGDFRRWNQSEKEFGGLVEDVLGDVADDKDGYDPFYDSVWNFNGLENDGSDVDSKKVVFMQANATTPANTDYVYADGSEVPDGDGDCTDVVPADVTPEVCPGYKMFHDEAMKAIGVYLNNLYN